MTDRSFVMRHYLFLAGHEPRPARFPGRVDAGAESTVEAKLHAELDAVLGDRAPSLDHLPRLAYTGHIITESLRLYPARGEWRVWSSRIMKLQDSP